MATEFRTHFTLPPPPEALVLGQVEGSLGYAWHKASDYERFVLEYLEKLLIPHPLRHATVKIRCTRVKAGEFPCAKPDWHYDHVLSEDDPRAEERHALFVTGIPVLFDRDYALPPYTVGTYGRVRHRATRSPVNQTRLMVRLSESDVVKPHNRSDR